MKTKISLKKLLKFINPSKHGVYYKNKLLIVDFKQIKNYIDNPIASKLFEKNDDIEVTFYKNAALYIINHQNPSFVSINLDKDNPIESGLFELIKSIYLKEEDIYVSLADEGNNLSFIKKEALKEVEEETFPSKSINSDLNSLAPILTTDNNETPIVKDNMFFWKSDNSDLYNDEEYILNHLKSKIYPDGLSSKNSTLTLVYFNDLLNKISINIKESDEFKLKLLELDSYVIDGVAASFQNQNFIIDFSKPIFHNFLEQSVLKNKFYLLDQLFEEYKKDKNKNATHFNNIDYAHFINQANTINYLIEKQKSSYQKYSYDHYDFDIVNCYAFFNKENQENEELIKSYIKMISRKNSSTTHISVSDILKLSPIIFDNRSILSLILPYLTDYSIVTHFNKLGYIPKLLSDKKFILDNINNISTYATGFFLNHFFKEENIDKPFFLALITHKPDLFNNLDHLHKKNWNQDLDVIMLQGAKSKSNIDIYNIKKHLLIDHADPKVEKFKTQYIIDTDFFEYKLRHLSVEENQKIKEKYFKIENLYYLTKTRSYSYEKKERKKLLSKIKDKNEVLRLFNKIIEESDSYTIDYTAFYKELNFELKKDIDIINAILRVGNLSYNLLPETLLFNKDLAIKFMSDDTPPSLVFKEFFNDIDFVLKFTKIMDNKNNDSNFKKQIPLFITKFFENQKVTQDFHQFLEKYIQVNQLKNQLDSSDTKTKVKRQKI